MALGTAVPRGARSPGLRPRARAPHSPIGSPRPRWRRTRTLAIWTGALLPASRASSCRPWSGSPPSWTTALTITWLQTTSRGAGTWRRRRRRRTSWARRSAWPARASATHLRPSLTTKTSAGHCRPSPTSPWCPVPTSQTRAYGTLSSSAQRACPRSTRTRRLAPCAHSSTPLSLARWRPARRRTRPSPSPRSSGTGSRPCTN
mmetsp:Transcript_23787/g.73960  ORF Transcript_23787/g.73960 Transcript_23787/m.73960 type:complete len:203 (-) Transcript_23787:1003-1611(-)